MAQIKNIALITTTASIREGSRMKLNEKTIFYLSNTFSLLIAAAFLFFIGYVVISRALAAAAMIAVLWGIYGRQ